MHQNIAVILWQFKYSKNSFAVIGPGLNEPYARASQILFSQIEEEIEEVTEYDATDLDDKKVITTKTSKPTTVSTTPLNAIRSGIDCVLADMSDETDKKVPFPEFGVDIVFRKGDFTFLLNQGK